MLGNQAANFLQGNGGGDTLAGGVGDDTLDGGAGTDTARFAGRMADYGITVAGDLVIVVDLRVSDGDEGTDEIHGIEFLQFSDATYTVGTTPDTGALFTEGADTVDFNTVTAGSYTAGTQYAALGGDDAVTLATSSSAASDAGYDRSKSFDAGAGNDTVTGSGLADWIKGGEGDDLLDGRGNSDRLEGGEGDDIYRVDRSGDIVIELAGEGTDTLNASSSFVLQANVEHLVLTGNSGSDATGNAASNMLTGNSGDNELSGCKSIELAKERPL